jgi:hypothetical protein
MVRVLQGRRDAQPKLVHIQEGRARIEVDLFRALGGLAFC